MAGAGFPRAGGLFGNGSGIVLLFLLAEHATGVPVAGMLQVSAGGGVVAASGGCVAWGAVLRVKERQLVRESFWVWRAAVPVGLRQTACWVRLSSFIIVFLNFGECILISELAPQHPV